MYRKMLVPLDGSELAESVFVYVKELAGGLDIDVIVLHVAIPGLDQFTPMREAYVAQSAEKLQSDAREVQSKRTPKPKKAVKITGELAVGYPAEEILRYSEEKKIDLIVMATHGRSGLKRWSLGSVADKILRASNIPVWLVRPGVTDAIPYDQWKERTLIVPLDGSELAEKVLPHVEVLTKQPGGKPVEVVLLRVSEPPALPSYYVPEISEVPLNWGEYEQQEIAKGKQAAEEYLAQIQKRLNDAGVARVKTEVIVGKADSVIVDYAGKHPCGVIVMASHGRSGISRWVYGSVAQNVLQGVSCPVFLIRPS